MDTPFWVRGGGA